MLSPDGPPSGACPFQLCNSSLEACELLRKQRNRHSQPRCSLFVPMDSIAACRSQSPNGQSEGRSGHLSQFRVVASSPFRRHIWSCGYCGTCGRSAARRLRKPASHPSAVSQHSGGKRASAPSPKQWCVPYVDEIISKSGAIGMRHGADPEWVVFRGGTAGWLGSFLSAAITGFGSRRAVSCARRSDNRADAVPGNYS